MGRVVEFDSDNRAKKQVADDEVDMFGANAIEVGLPITMSIVGINKVGEPYFGEYDMISDDAAQRVVKARFGFCQRARDVPITRDIN
jgi:hypothetical protein